MPKEKEIIKTKMQEPKTWKEVESPNFFKFNKIGDMIQGNLIRRDTSDRYGFGIYTINMFNGETKRFHGSSQLDDLLINIDLPCYVKIEYIDNQETANGIMKLFKVSKGIN